MEPRNYNATKLINVTKNQEETFQFLHHLKNIDKFDQGLRFYNGINTFGW